MKIPILIVESDMRAAMEIAETVESSLYDVVTVTTGPLEAYRQALRHQPHVVFMAMDLRENGDGIAAAEAILLSMQTALIYITSCDDATKIERAVRTGPAAYLMKPLGPKKIIVALKIALLRYRRQAASLHVKEEIVVLNEAFRYNRAQRRLFHFATPIHLTTRENELLNLLVNTRHSVLSTYNMENAIWPDTPPAESTRRALVSRLRSKLNHQGIETLPGIGYRLNF